MKIAKWCGLALAAVSVLGVMESATAAGPGGRPGRGGRPSFDKLLEAFDADENEELTEEEVPALVWLRLSRADADENGSVTRAEFDAFKPGPGGQ